MKKLIRILREIAHDQRGFALVLVTMGMVALLGFAALVTDIGMLILTKQRLSNAVDAAALAGGHELPGSADLARDTAQNYALQNGCNTDTPLVSAYDGRQDSKITVTAAKEVDFTFARVLGINSGTVNARASAGVNGLSSYRGAAPLAIPDQVFDFNTLYKLKQGSNDPVGSPLGPGTYGALSLGGNGASTYENNLKYGYGEKLSRFDVIDTETGNISGPTKDALAYRIGLCNHSPVCSPSHFDPGCSRIIIIPVYEPVVIDKGQVKRIRIVGFAAFLVDSVVPGSGNENEIYGHFIRMVVDGEADADQADYGLKGVKLIE